jgi:hypothetical protein
MMRIRQSRKPENRRYWKFVAKKEPNSVEPLMKLPELDGEKFMFVFFSASGAAWAAESGEFARVPRAESESFEETLAASCVHRYRHPAGEVVGEIDWAQHSFYKRGIPAGRRGRDPYPKVRYQKHEAKGLEKAWENIKRAEKRRSFELELNRMKASPSYLVWLATKDFNEYLDPVAFRIKDMSQKDYFDIWARTLIENKHLLGPENSKWDFLDLVYEKLMAREKQLRGSRRAKGKKFFTAMAMADASA